LSPAQITFYCISAFILGTGFLAVTTRKIFRSAIWLLFSLVGIAALYFFLQVEFIAAVQVVVYVGGIVVLILFSIFLTQQSGNVMPQPKTARIILSVLAGLAGFGLAWTIISGHDFVLSSSGFAPTVTQIGIQMLSPTQYGYVLPFEVVSVLLLAALIACIVIAMKSQPTEK
jgi:NADH-quinone oxidoreductase subunit J